MKIMHKYDLISRLKRIEQTEIALCRKEAQISKSFTRYITSLKKIKHIIENERISCESIQHFHKLQQMNAKLQTILKSKAEEVERSKNEILAIQEKCEALAEKQFTNDWNQIESKDKLHSLQEICNIFINKKTLPDFVQGMSIRESQQEKHLLPFRFAAIETDVQTTQDFLWSIAEHSSLYNQQWEYLFFGDNT